MTSEDDIHGLVLREPAPSPLPGYSGAANFNTAQADHLKHERHDKVRLYIIATLRHHRERMARPSDEGFPGGLHGNVATSEAYLLWRKRLTITITLKEMVRTGTRQQADAIYALVEQRFLDCATQIVDEWSLWVDRKLGVSGYWKVGLTDDFRWTMWPVPVQEDADEAQGR